MQGTWAWVFWSHSGFPLALVGSTWNPRLGLWKVAGFFFFFKTAVDSTSRKESLYYGDPGSD